MKTHLQLITIAILTSISPASSHAAGPPPIEDPSNHAGVGAGIEIALHCVKPLFSNAALIDFARCNECVRDLCYRTFMDPELLDPYSQADIFLCEADRRNAAACIALGEFFCPDPIAPQPPAKEDAVDSAPE